MTPWWITLLVGLLGLTGVAYTQWRADARERATFERERRREQDQWEREDRLRTFEERSAAMVDFYTAAERMQDKLSAAEWSLEALEEARREHREVLHGKLAGIHLYGSATVWDRAYDTWNAAANWLHDIDVTSEAVSEYSRAFRDARFDLSSAIRTDLGVPTLRVEDIHPRPVRQRADNGDR